MDVWFMVSNIISDISLIINPYSEIQRVHSLGTAAIAHVAMPGIVWPANAIYHA